LDGKILHILDENASDKKKYDYQSFAFLEPEYDPDTEVFLPRVEEVFDISEGNTFKGHKGSVRDIIRITHNEFASCDDSG
jgi:hypothetical protein